MQENMGMDRHKCLLLAKISNIGACEQSIFAVPLKLFQSSRKVFNIGDSSAGKDPVRLFFASDE